jgi:hypothetical protein
MPSEIDSVFALRAAKIIAALKRRAMEGYFAADRAAAVVALRSLMQDGQSVAWGGSTSLARDLGFIDVVRRGPYRVIDRDAAKTPEEAEQAFRESFCADTYLMGTNAITLDGELVNVDARGNRVAALAYGPRQVLVVAGRNKVCADLPAALRRAREEAAPPNALRLGYKTPCSVDGLCHDCLGEACICCQTLITRMSRVPGRIKVVLVGEDLGF